jgi:hypothetical protein
VKTHNQPVPLDKIKQFHEILVACGGRYIGEPTKFENEYRVSYQYDDVQAQNTHNFRWSRIYTPIEEKRTDQWWRKLGCRCLLPFRLLWRKIW